MIPALVIVLSMLALFLALCRIVMGPRNADRIVALDIFFSASVALCVVASWKVERTVFLDVGIGLSLVGFVSTVCWARLLDRASAQDPSGDYQ